MVNKKRIIALLTRERFEDSGFGAMLEYEEELLHFNHCEIKYFRLKISLQIHVKSWELVKSHCEEI